MSALMGDLYPYPQVYGLTEYIPRFVQVIRHRWPRSAGQVPTKLQVLVTDLGQASTHKYSWVLAGTYGYNKWMAIKEHYIKLQVHQILWKTLPKHYCSSVACSFLWKWQWSHLTPQHQGGHIMPLALMLFVYSHLKVSDASSIQSSCHGKMHILCWLM